MTRVQYKYFPEPFQVTTHLSFLKKSLCTMRRTKTIKRNPTTAASPTSHGCSVTLDVSDVARCPPELHCIT